MQRFFIYGHTLLGSNHAKVRHDVLYSDPVEVVSLTTRKNGRKNLMFLRCSKNEDSVCRWFLEGLEECIEGRLREHMDLIDDVHAILAHLRRYAHLVHQGLDVFHTVVRCGIQFMNAI